ncbi:multiple stress resistance protein BhsA [Salmonella enterica subsp. enterica serovar Choleraesuis]|nr:multiple stress resistance protein BhsA [Salmonella enterica subsp. enterica serovar Choleraesuis]
MKNIAMLIAALTLGSLSFAASAAVEVQSAPADQQKIGTISAEGGLNLSSVEKSLAAKAEAMGAESYRITSVSGTNRLHGTAVIYK